MQPYDSNLTRYTDRDHPEQGKKTHYTQYCSMLLQSHNTVRCISPHRGKKQSSQGKKVVLISKDGVYYRSARRKMDLQQPRLNLYANLSQSVSMRHSLRLPETNNHLLLMALMHTLHYKNSCMSQLEFMRRTQGGHTETQR